MSTLIAAKEQFLVASRRLTKWQMALSIAATWIWAPALFVAAQQAYVNGFWGLFWFTVPNVAALIVFAPYALRLRRRVPEGYTLSAYMRERYSKRVQVAYLAQLSIQDVCAFAVQLVAGGAILSAVTGWGYVPIVLGMAGVVVAYSVVGGLRASVVTDHAQMLIIGAVILGVSIPIATTAGLEPIRAGLTSVTGDASPLMVMLTFGIPSTIILLSGPFGFSAFWQRGFAAADDETVTKSYLHSAWIFAIVPLGLGILGLIGAGTGLAVDDAQLTNLAVVAEYLPNVAVWVFAVAVLMGLLSTLDSSLSATSTLWGHDLSTYGQDGRARARQGMGILAVLAVGVALIPGVTVLYLWFFYGTSRAATLAPTVLTLGEGKVAKSLTERGVFWGVVAGLVFGGPVMIYGRTSDQWQFVLAGALAAVLLSAGLVLATRRRAVARPTR